MLDAISHGADRTTATLVLKKGKEQSIERRHPWIFSGALDDAAREGDPAQGDLVRVCDRKGKVLGYGHYQDATIMVRMLGFGPVEPGPDHLRERLAQAFALRKTLGLAGAADTDVYRLVHGDGDQLPGLVIDRYAGTAVLQAHSLGMYRRRALVAEALADVCGNPLAGVYDKSAESLAKQLPPGAANGPLLGTPDACPAQVCENGRRFLVDWEQGQKTGFFIDQRESRALVARFAAGRRVLNTFSYTGGFSVYALSAGAKRVVSVDASAGAVEMSQRNAELNGAADRHEAVKSDVIPFLTGLTGLTGPDASGNAPFDLVILDPPAYAKHVKSRHHAIQGYKRLNALAMRKIGPDGLLFTYSCSQVVTRELFEKTVLAAAIEAGREMQILGHLGQAPDHPVSIFHPEGEYLKGLFLHLR